MSIEKIHLNKLLKFMYLPEKELTSALRQDIRDEINKKAGIETGGGNFYMPFWHDAKLHVAGKGDIAELTRKRIKKNDRRRNLYPRLSDGLQQMWTRGDNQVVEPLELNPKGNLLVESENLTVKIDNFMAISIDGEERLVYPYWFPSPALSEEAARIGLHVISETFGAETAKNVRIWDVMRADYYALYSHPLYGDEKQHFLTKYKYIKALRDKLMLEY